MTGGSVSDFQKNATVFNNADLTVTGVTITGGGAQTIIAQNGIQVLNSTGTISGNIITGIGYAGPQVVYSGAVLAYGNTNLDITGNTIEGANSESTDAKVVGVFVLDFGSPNNGGMITGNTISHVDEAIDVSGEFVTAGITVGVNLVSSIDLTDQYAAGVYFSPDPSAASFNVTGTGFNDVLYGSMGADVLTGLAGNDEINGGAGDDSLTGGADYDTATYTSTLSASSFSSVSGNILVAAGSEGTDQLNGIEKVTANGQNFLLVGAGGYADNEAAAQDWQSGDVIIDSMGDYGTPLEVTVNNTLVSKAEQTAVEFTVAGLDLDATAIVTFTDETLNVVTINVSAGANGNHVVDLTQGQPSALGDGPIMVTITALDSTGLSATGVGASLTLDTTLATPTVALTSDTGSSNADTITNNAALTISAANETVTREYSLDGGTTWTGSYTAPTINGGYTVQVRDTDVAGNSAIGSLSFTLDTTAPTAATTTIAEIITDSGNSSDFITNIADVTVTGAFTGILGSGETIQVSADGTNWVNAGILGNVWFANVTLANGEGTLSTQTVDTAGNITVGASHGYTLDNNVVAPGFSLNADTGSNGTDRITKDGLVNVSGLEAGATWQYTTDGTNWNNGVGNSFMLGEGAYVTGNIQVRQTDLAGNTSTATSNAATIAVDATPPTTPGFALASDTGSSGSDGITSNGLVNVSGLELGATWQYTTNGTDWNNGAGNSFMLGEGTYVAGNIQVRQTDVAGNLSTATSNAAAITVDATITAPSIALNHDTGSSSDGITKDGVVNVTLAADIASWRYSINGGGIWTTGSGASFTLAQGTYTAGSIKVEQTDVAGNTSTPASNTAIITVDTTAPIAMSTTITQIAIDTGTSGDFITTQGNVTVSGQYTGALGSGEKIQVSANGGTTWVDASASSPIWAAANVALIPGSGTLTTRTIDTAGNEIVGASHSYVFNPIYYGTPNPDTLSGTSADEQFFGLASNDTINGGAGNDLLDGGEGNDSLIGGLGDDTYVLDTTGDKVIELYDQGIDTIRTSVSRTLGDHQENMILSGSASTAAYGNGLDNNLTGNDGNNYLDGKLGADNMSGGKGNDYYWIDDLGDVVLELANEGTDEVKASITYTLTANVERLTLLGSSNTDAYGNELRNVLAGNSGNNVLDGGLDADTMRGGLGDDTYVIDNNNDVISESGGGGTDTVMSWVSRTLSTDLENLVLLGTSSTAAYGNSLANVLVGNDGNNYLDGKLGADNMSGGKGNDYYWVDDLGDVVLELANEGTDEVKASITYTLTANVERLSLLGSSHINAFGNDLNNVLTGNAGKNILDGGLGADTMRGGLGNDTYVVNNVGDVTSETDGGGVDNVLTSVTRTLGTDLENLTLTGTASINGTGNVLANMLRGNDASNTLSGGSGADTLAGGLGNDTLTGGADADRLVFDTAPGSSNVDTITDFSAGADKLQLDHLVFSGLGTGPGLSATMLVAGPSLTLAQDADDHLIYNTSNGALYYDADGVGGDAAIQIATLTGIPTLMATDFLIS